MATIKKFEGLEIWQMGRRLNGELIFYLKVLNDTREFELKNQLNGSAGSVMDNIAEGFERDGNREFLQFLAISKGSLSEVRTQLYRVFDRPLIGEKEFESLQGDCLLLAFRLAHL